MSFINYNLYLFNRINKDKYGIFVLAVFNLIHVICNL